MEGREKGGREKGGRRGGKSTGGRRGGKGGEEEEGRRGGRREERRKKGEEEGEGESLRSCVQDKLCLTLRGAERLEGKLLLLKPPDSRILSDIDKFSSLISSVKPSFVRQSCNSLNSLRNILSFTSSDLAVLIQRITTSTTLQEREGGEREGERGEGGREGGRGRER